MLSIRAYSSKACFLFLFAISPVLLRQSGDEEFLFESFARTKVLISDISGMITSGFPLSNCSALAVPPPLGLEELRASSSY